MIRYLRWQGGVRSAIALLVLVTGCQNLDWGRKDELPPEPAPKPAPRDNPVLTDTIGAHTLLSGVTGQRVRGFSLVVGLGDAGSPDCPTAIREYLTDYLSLQLAPKGSGEPRPRLSPERLIDSSDTAVVEVVGVVPAGAPRGMRFDVSVQAVPGTATRSLEGGLLLPCELRIFEAAPERGGVLGGRKVAMARGPVFTNPFGADANASGSSDQRHGFVLSGGHTFVQRSTRLLLLEPSYSLARRIERRLNERFGHRPPSAEAMSKGYVWLHTPPQFAARPERFIQIATHLYLPNHPAFYEQQLRELANYVAQSPDEGERVALVWEALGRVAVPHIQPLYAHRNPSVRFYAARSGLRLKDATALPVMNAIAADREHAHRLQAVVALGACAFSSAALQLTPLLDDPEPAIRIAAYEGLLRHRHTALIETRVFASAIEPSETSLILDVVESDADPLIYVRRTREPRLAVFGPRTPVMPPLYYSHPQERVVLNAAAETGDVTLFYRSPVGHRLSERIVVPARLTDLIVALADLPVNDEADRLRGVGLSYSQVVRVLAALERDGALSAQIVIESESLTDLLGPAEVPERPEADEPPADGEPDLPADDSDLTFERDSS